MLALPTKAMSTPNDELTSQHLVQQLNIKNQFDFEYTPLEGYNLETGKSISKKA